MSHMSQRIRTTEKNAEADLCFSVRAELSRVGRDVCIGLKAIAIVEGRGQETGRRGGMKGKSRVSWRCRNGVKHSDVVVSANRVAGGCVLTNDPFSSSASCTPPSFHQLTLSSAPLYSRIHNNHRRTRLIVLSLAVQVPRFAHLQSPTVIPELLHPRHDFRELSSRTRLGPSDALRDPRFSPL
jgi:hypothetical protein